MRKWRVEDGIYDGHTGGGRGSLGVESGSFLRRKTSTLTTTAMMMKRIPVQRNTELQILTAVWSDEPKI